MLHLERDEGTYDFIVFNGDMDVATAYYVEEENHAWELVLNDDNSTLLGTKLFRVSFRVSKDHKVLPPIARSYDANCNSI